MSQLHYPELNVSNLQVSDLLVKGKLDQYPNVKRILNNTDNCIEYMIKDNNVMILAYAYKNDINIYLPKTDDVKNFEICIKDASILYQNKVPFGKRYNIKIISTDGSLIESIEGKISNYTNLVNISSCLTLQYTPSIGNHSVGLWLIKSYFIGFNIKDDYFIARNENLDKMISNHPIQEDKNIINHINDN